METRPRVPRTGTAPRHPVGHHPAATRRRETRPAAPATRWGVEHKSATRGERKEVWRAGAPTHGTGEPQTPWGTGRVAWEAAYRDSERGGDNHPTRARRGRVCSARAQCSPTGDPQARWWPTLSEPPHCGIARGGEAQEGPRGAQRGVAPPGRARSTWECTRGPSRGTRQTRCNYGRSHIPTQRHTRCRGCGRGRRPTRCGDSGRTQLSPTRIHGRGGRG